MTIRLERIVAGSRIACPTPYTPRVATNLLVRDRHVLAIQAAIGWCLGGLGPVLILGARDLDVPRYQLAWLGSAFGFTLLGAGLLGRRALGRGPAPVVRAGVLLLAGGTTLLGFGSTLPLLGLGGLLQGAGCSAFLIATPALVGTEDRAHRLALAVGASSVAGLIAPGAVALADRLLPTGRVALVLPLLWVIPSALAGTGLSGPSGSRVLPGISSVGRMTSSTWWRWLAIVLAVSAEFCFWTWGAARLVDAGVTDSAASGLVAAFAIGMALGRIIGPQRLRSPVTLSAFVTSLAGALVMLSLGIEALVAALFLAGLGIAVLYPVLLDFLLAVSSLPEERLIALAAYASGVAITITPLLLGVLDRIMPIRFAFGLVPLLLATMVWVMRLGRSPVAASH
jgi:hypothetical protein